MASAPTPAVSWPPEGNLDRAILVICLCCTAACFGPAVTLTEGGTRVRLVYERPSSDQWDELGPVEASLGGNLRSPGSNDEAVKLELRNRAAALGAEIVLVTESHPAVSLNFSSIRGVAYRRKAIQAAPAPPASQTATVAAQPAPSSQPPPSAPAFAGKGRLAVLEFRNFDAGTRPETVRYFTDLVRQATLRAAPGLEVMTRENLLVLIKANGVDLENCEGECEVETGRRIGADLIVSGDLQRVGSKYKISMRLHDTHEGRLLAASVASGATLDELDESASQVAGRLFQGSR